MIPSLLRFAFVALAGAAFAVGTSAAELPIIAKARAYIGPEAALNAITAIRYTGNLVTRNPDDPSKETRAIMEITFQKPHQQRITATSANSVETTALDGYEGWQRLQELGADQQWKQTLLRPEHIKRLRANTWENLAFFRGLEEAGGQVEDLGRTTVDGITCQKVAFIHNPAVTFFRYFDVDTGRLVLTETESGGTIRERGEMRVQGLRFPKSIITSTKNAQGKVQEVTIEFESVYLNERFPPSYFAVPLPKR